MPPYRGAARQVNRARSSVDRGRAAGDEPPVRREAVRGRQRGLSERGSVDQAGGKEALELRFEDFPAPSGFLGADLSL